MFYVIIVLFYDFVTNNENYYQKNKPTPPKGKNNILIVNDTRYDGIEKYLYYHAGSQIRVKLIYPNRRIKDQYKLFNTSKELEKTRRISFLNKSGVESTGVFKKRDPVNSLERTRAILMNLNDNQLQSFFADGVTGCIWRTQDMGKKGSDSCNSRIKKGKFC